MMQGSVKGVLRITGIIGFVIGVIATYVLMTYFVVPVIRPILIHEIESQLSNEGITVSQQEISSIISMTTTLITIGTPLGLFIAWLIQSAVLLGLFRAFRIGAGFVDTWLISGNYFYIAVISSAVQALTPILGYTINAVTTHRNPLTIPQLLGLDLAFIIVGSVLLAYLFSRVYNTAFTRTLIPVLISFLIFMIIATVV